MAAYRGNIQNLRNLGVINGDQVYYDADNNKIYRKAEVTTYAGVTVTYPEITSGATYNATRYLLDGGVGAGSVSSGPIGGSTKTTLKVKIDGKDVSSSSLRYPRDFIDQSSDYVLFQFGKYRPPFSAETGNLTMNEAYKDYNASINDLELKGLLVKDAVTGKDDLIENIMLPMPQDLSNELKSDWQAKSFTRLGKSAIAAAAAGNFQNITSTLKDVSGNLKALQGAVVSNVLNNLPGVGGNLSINDVTGSTRGIVLNPNAEVLYDSPNMREIGMVFKMVPKNAYEAALIKKICDTFRSASLPTYGAEGDINTFKKEGGDTFAVSGDNFIRVPYLCKFTFMSGSSKNNWIAQFKPCAITRVQVNYTADGTYATYTDGSPISTELSINFLESKIIYQNEVVEGF